MPFLVDPQSELTRATGIPSLGFYSCSHAGSIIVGLSALVASKSLASEYRKSLFFLVCGSATVFVGASLINVFRAVQHDKLRRQMMQQQVCINQLIAFASSSQNSQVSSAIALCRDLGLDHQWNQGDEKMMLTAVLTHPEKVGFARHWDLLSCLWQQYLRAPLSFKANGRQSL